MIESAIAEWARRRGYRAAWGPVSVLDEIKSGLLALRESGALEPRFVRERISRFFEPQEYPFENPKSLLIVAVPRPTHSVAFETSCGRIDALLPPTYVNYRRTMTSVRDGLRAQVFGDGPRLEICFVPVKSAATRLGLAEYGRNNITYVEGMGSYHELVGLVTDAELRPDPGRPVDGPRPLDECESCDRCIRSCPTGAIPRDRFLIHAESCLTNHNESEEPFPADVPLTAHHCLVGCLVCQRVCPVNKRRYKVEETGVLFDREETETFLRCEKKGADPACAAVGAKFGILGLTEDAPVMGRNLRALIDRRASE